MANGTIQVGTGGMGTRFISKDYPVEYGLEAGTTKHHIDNHDYDDETDS